MTDQSDGRRRRVLVDFHAACRRPTAGELAAWVERHPDLADDLRDHAEAALAAAQEGHLRAEPSEGLLARTRSAALDALEAARAGAASRGATSDLEGLIAAAGTDVPGLARALGLGRAPLVDLVQGRVALPAPVALLAALADALRTTVAAVDAAIRAAPPRVGPARALAAPSALHRPFAEIVEDDAATSPEARARWLALLEG